MLPFSILDSFPKSGSLYTVKLPSKVGVPVVTPLRNPVALSNRPIVVYSTPSEERKSPDPTVPVLNTKVVPVLVAYFALPPSGR